jgi:hypothetical protein
MLIITIVIKNSKAYLIPKSRRAAEKTLKVASINQDIDNRTASKVQSGYKSQISLSLTLSNYRQSFNK